MGVRAVAMATKFGPKIALISSLQEIEKFIAVQWGFRGWWISIRYQNFYGSQGSCHGNQI